MMWASLLYFCFLWQAFFTEVHGQSCTQGAIRLQGTIRNRRQTSTKGRVEICNNNVWGTVCDNGWGPSDAKVACRQLGLNTTGAVAFTQGVPAGTGQIWLDNVRCSGRETRLIDCPANPLGSHNCAHSQDVGVSCPGNICTQGGIRLQGGANSLTGRVEICNQNEWGTVCDDHWGTADAQVACRQLDLSPRGAVALTSGFIHGAGQIWLDNVHCRGTELRLIDCPAKELGLHNCVHNEDAGVRCLPPCTQGAVRLQGGTSTRGRVEVCNNNVWSTLCSAAFRLTSISVVCRQLGLSTYGAVDFRLRASDRTRQIWKEFVCLGNEARLIDCPASPLSSYSCAQGQDVGVSCPDFKCTHGEIRLRGGNNSTSGRVEICYLNEWGTVCDDYWGTADAKVACRQLNLGVDGAVALTSGFTNGAGQIWLDNVRCSGREAMLILCGANELGSHNCVHNDDAGVRCGPTCNYGDIRLRGGTDRHGRVEMCRVNEWGTICDNSWDYPDAQVVCRQLGFTARGAFALRGEQTPDGTGPIWLDYVHCPSTELKLMGCPATNARFGDCSHANDAGVSCP